MSQDLDRFVRDAMAAGRTRDDIRATLTRAGWPADAVDGALAAYADIDYPVPVPRPRPYVSAGEAFLYLVMFSTLYAAAFSLGALVFSLIELTWPDAAVERYLANEHVVHNGLRWSIAWLVISYPLYLWLARRTSAAVRREPGKRRSRVRKWLTYVTLFVAAGVLLGDVVTLVYNLLAGELTVRFLAKVATVAAIAGAAFGHYRAELRRDDLSPAELAAPRPAARRLAVAATVAIVAAVLAGFVTIGSPGSARAKRLDDRRERELSRIADAVDTYYETESALPPSLDALASHRGVYGISIQDPVSGRPYAYEPSGERTYRLCAEFDTEVAGDDDHVTAHGVSRFWNHGRGDHCFDVEVVEER